ncbi:hypothetical protein [Paraburkholderia humisilvae]|uniref:Glycine zipper 2TM domain-containing protein n=1 Tax=Paraburkholderia humisilvae TaxID=627669 RepID=A0A6J5DNR2_9BURK|nr:hypothetical protein [Paraburkholderia humisilvae]CAB3754635.1 hypothetical protein LMG29542_02406 [Paraburkholderia humisilvae]
MKSFAKIGRTVLVTLMMLPLFAHAQMYRPLVQYGEPVSMSASTYNSGDALQNGGTALFGQVVNARPVLIDTGAGRQVGVALGVVGTLLGMGHHSRMDPLIGGAVGATVGYVAGSAISKVRGVELIVRTQDNRLLTVVQAIDDGGVFMAGQPVAVVMVSGRLRVERV